MRKKLFALFTLTLSLLLLSACSNKETVDMKSFEGDGYIGIEWEERKYVPYCVLDYLGGGSLIGYLDGDKKEEIYSFEDFPVKEWIVDHSKYDRSSMLFREINVAKSPGGIISDYEWNN